MYRSRASLGRKRGHRAPAIRPGGTLGLSETADSDTRLFQDSTGMMSVLIEWSLCQCLACVWGRVVSGMLLRSLFMFPNICRAKGLPCAIFR